MSITLDRTTVPARDKTASARFVAKLFGLTYNGRCDRWQRSG